MTLALLSGATGNPINSQRRIAQQASRGIPATSNLRDFRSNLGPIRLVSQQLDRLVVASGGQPQSGLTGKLDVDGGPIAIGDIDPANLGMMNCLANAIGHYHHTDNTSWQRWYFAIDQDTAAAGWLTMLDDNDVLPRARITDMLLGGFTVAVQPSQNLQISFPFVASEVDFHGDPSQTVGTGSTLPILKRTWSGNLAADAVDKDIYVKVTDVTLYPVSVVVQAKVGAAAVYSNTQTIILGQWNRLEDESGARIGTFAEQVQLYWPTSATLVATDIFKIPNRKAAAWSPSLTVARPISSVNTLFMIDGVETRVEGGWNVEAAWGNLGRAADVAGRQGATVERTGTFGVTISPTRRVTDLTLQNALLQASSVAVVIDCLTDAEIGASGRPYRFLVIAPNCKVTGPSYGAEAGGQNRDEAVTLVAEQPDATYSDYDSIDVDAHLAVIVENDVTAL